MINTLFISDKDMEKLSHIYISYSSSFLQYIHKNNLYSLYSNTDPLLVPIDNHNEQSIGLIEQYKSTRKRINDFCSEEHAKVVMKEQLLPKNLKKLNADEFLIELMSFPTQNEFIMGNEENDDFISMSNIMNDVNFRSYNSTINFIDYLCDISFRMGSKPREQQAEFLFKELYEINLSLPGLVYLPFLKNSTRNYMICHISLPETKIFRTKTRAPIMLTFELIRLDEVSTELKKKENNNSNMLRDRSHSINSSTSSNYSKIKESFMMLENLDIYISKPLLISKKKTKVNQNANKKKVPYSQKTEEKAINDLVSRSTMMHPHFSKEFEKKLDVITEESEIEDEKISTIRKRFKMRDDMKKSIQLKDSAITFSDAKDDDLIFMNNSCNNSNLFGNHSELNKNRSANVADNSQPINIDLSDKNKEDEDIIQSKGQQEKQLIKFSSIPEEDLKKIFGELFIDQHRRIKETSLFGNFNSHQIFKAIIKTNEDLRQEQFSTQLINEFYQIFQIEKVKCWLNTYEIIATGNSSGLIEMVPDTLSLDQLKQKTNNMSLRDFYLNYWGNGNPKHPEYRQAMKNFVRSLAGYSLVCYFLQIKDRHNGNILIDAQGHLIHIDFGFLLSNAPGKGLKFENAPFKLTNDMVNCLGGIESDYFKKFQKRLKKGYVAISKHRHKIIILVEMMWCGHGKNLPCFQNQQMTITDLKNRLNPRPGMKKTEKYKFVDELIGQSVDNWRTKWYDIFQYQFQGIFY